MKGNELHKHSINQKEKGKIGKKIYKYEIIENMQTSLRHCE